MHLVLVENHTRNFVESVVQKNVTSQGYPICGCVNRPAICFSTRFFCLRLWRWGNGGARVRTLHARLKCLVEERQRFETTNDPTSLPFSRATHVDDRCHDSGRLETIKRFGSFDGARRNRLAKLLHANLNPTRLFFFLHSFSSTWKYWLKQIDRMRWDINRCAVNFLIRYLNNYLLQFNYLLFFIILE